MTEPGLFDEPPAALIKASRAPIPSAFPDWLKTRMERAGLMDPDTGATRRARARFCDNCRQSVMRGIDEDFGGKSSDADPTPLSQLGEVMALMAGRRTFELNWTGGYGYTLTRRGSPERISGRPAGTKGMDVLIGHVCGLPDIFDHDVTRLADKTINAPLPDKAPF